MPYDQDSINRQLREGDSSQIEESMRQRVRANIFRSRDRMSKQWPVWDRHDSIYRGISVVDGDDVRAMEQGKPPKIIVPITYAQIQTAVSFLLSLFSDRRNLIELHGRTPDSVGKALALESDLGYQLQRQRFMLTLYIWLLDLMKYGTGVVKCGWEERFEMRRVRTQSAGNVVPFDEIGQDLQQTLGLFALDDSPSSVESVSESVERVKSYEGNVITPVSPFSFYPDPAVRVSDFQEGLFVGHEEVKSHSELLRRQQEGAYHGVEHLRRALPNQDPVSGLSAQRRVGQDIITHSSGGDARTTPTHVILTEMQENIVPAHFAREYGVNDLGDEDYPVKFVVVMANDHKIVAIERLGYLHDKFTYAVAEHNPDSSYHLSPGMADAIDELQSTITWFVNSHIRNVREVIQNRLIGDPKMLNMDDIDKNRRFIRTKSGATGVRNLEAILRQLNVTDVTGNHVSDAQVLFRLVQVVTGVSDNALGQHSPGRRSATENRNVNQGTASRLLMHAQLFYWQGLEPLAEQMIANTRQNRTEEMYNAILGSEADKHPFDEVILASPDAIASALDFAPFNPMLPNDRVHAANVLQEAFGTVISGGMETAQALDLSPKLLLEHVLRLLHVTNINDFSIQNDAHLQQMMQGVGASTEVVPDDVAEQATGPTADVFGEQLLRQSQTG